jgi:hypothetical protein
LRAKLHFKRTKPEWWTPVSNIPGIAPDFAILIGVIRLTVICFPIEFFLEFENIQSEGFALRSAPTFFYSSLV